MKVTYKEIQFSFENKEYINIKEINFTSESIVSIIGKNGSGKSTLAKILSFVYESNMEVYLDDRLIKKEELNVKLVLQNPDFQFVKNLVVDDIAFGLENQGISNEEMKKRIDNYSKLFEIENLLDKRIDSLSGGQKQKIAIVSNLILEPDVLILDEVFEMLDSESKMHILSTLEIYRRDHQICIVNINHDEIINDIFDEVMMVENGKIVFQMISEDFFANKKLLKECDMKRPFKYDLMETLKINQNQYVEMFCK